MELDLLSNIKKTKHYNQLFNVPLKLQLDYNDYYDYYDNFDKLKVALFVNTCFGFGDIIFTLKIHNYIKEWYNIDATVVTTNPKKFIGRIKNLYCAKLKRTQKYTECINTNKMVVYNIDKDGNSTTLAKLPTFDVLFATPWIGTDFPPNRNLLKSLFPYTNKFNTFLFSEYNLPDYNKYDFPVGIGKNYCGILLSKNNSLYFKDIQKEPRLIENPYIIVHVSQHPYVNPYKCFANFVKLMCKKYNGTVSNLDIICPQFLLNTTNIHQLKKYILQKGYYNNVIILKNTDNNEESSYNTPFSGTSGTTLTFNSSILPLEYEKFQSLFYHSLPDILVTGDQSLTDIINSPKYFNLYYQIMPWKTNLAKKISTVLNTPYLKNVSSSCGLEKLDNTKMTDLKLISEKYSFEKLGKPKMDKIFQHAALLQKNTLLQTFQNIVLTSRSKKTVYNKLKKYLQKFN